MDDMQRAMDTNTQRRVLAVRNGESCLMLKVGAKYCAPKRDSDGHVCSGNTHWHQRDCHWLLVNDLNRIAELDKQIADLTKLRNSLLLAAAAAGHPLSDEELAAFPKAR